MAAARFLRLVYQEPTGSILNSELAGGITARCTCGYQKLVRVEMA